MQVRGTLAGSLDATSLLANPSADSVPCATITSRITRHQRASNLDIYVVAEQIVSGCWSGLFGSSHCFYRMPLCPCIEKHMQAMHMLRIREQASCLSCCCWLFSWPCTYGTVIAWQGRCLNACRSSVCLSCLCSVIVSVLLMRLHRLSAYGQSRAAIVSNCAFHIWTNLCAVSVCNTYLPRFIYFRIQYCSVPPRIQVILVTIDDLQNSSCSVDSLWRAHMARQ